MSMTPPTDPQLTPIFTAMPRSYLSSFCTVLLWTQLAEGIPEASSAPGGSQVAWGLLRIDWSQGAVRSGKKMFLPSGFFSLGADRQWRSEVKH